MEIKGVVEEIGEIESGQGKKDTWHKQLVVIKTLGEYPKSVAIMYWGKMVDTITRIGHEVTIHFNPESRSYNGRWYTELRAWKTEQGSGGNSEPSGLPQGSRISQEAEYNRPYEQPKSSSTIQDDSSDSLPF